MDEEPKNNKVGNEIIKDDEVHPIRPHEVILKKKRVPDKLIKQLNELIEITWDGHKAVIAKSAITNLIQSSEYSKNNLSVEYCLMVITKEVYPRSGWNVEYTNANPSYFTFKENEYIEDQ